MPKRFVLRAACLLGLLAPASAVADAAAVLLAPTPLVLKDGRIARVTVHSIPFPSGKDQPDEAARAALTALVEELATDCFLTAQAIGHVEPGPGSDGETLAAHRLARARADRVQAALTGRGLPPASIASVWDWQFAVREPRVTLWVFRLAEGDDCESLPIAQAQPAPAPVAVAEPEPPPAPLAVADPETTPAPVPPAPPQEPAPPVIVAAPEAPTATAEEEAPALALEAPEPEADLPPAPAIVAEATASEPQPVPAEPAPDDALLAITFDVNSSYFPKGINGELKALAAKLPTDGAYEIVLEGAVSAEAARNEPAGQDHAYNRWIADRRMGRVADWLRQHANGGSVGIRQTYAENDPSRRVSIRIRPLP